MRAFIVALAALGLAACSGRGSQARPAAGDDAGFAGSGNAPDEGSDAGISGDGGSAADAGNPSPPPDADGGMATDAGTPPPQPDGGTAADAGTANDGGTAGSGGTGAPYRLVDLGELDGTGVIAVGVTADGRALVRSFTHAALIDARTGATEDVSAVEKTIPWPFSAMNAQGDIAYTDRGAGTCDDQRVLVRMRDGSTRDHGTPPHGDLSAIDCSQRGGWALALSAAGALVTWKTHDGWRAFVGDGNSWHNLGDLGVNTMAAALNDAGDALLDSNGRIYLARNGAATWLAGVEGDSPTPLGLNAHGQVAGSMFEPSGPRRPATWSNGRLIELPRLPGHEAGVAIGINGSAAMVGCTHVSWDNSRGADHAMLWQDGAAYDLNELVATHELHLNCAHAIGDGGIIAGWGSPRSGPRHAFALLPQAPPSSGGGTPEFDSAAIAVTGRDEHALALAIDAASVYWLRLTGSRNSDSFAGWELRAAPKGGGAPRTLASGESEADDLLLDAAFAYVSNGQVLRVPLAGGAPVVLGEGSGQLAQDDSFIYSVIPPRLDEYNPAQLVRLSKAGGGQTKLADMAASSRAVALDAGTLYWSADQAFYSMPAGGGAPQKIAADPLLCAGRLRLAGGFAYVNCDGKIVRVALSGGAAQVLWSGPGTFNPRTDLDYSQGWVFWNETGGPTRDGCLWRAWADGNQASCLEASPFAYAAVRVDDQNIWFIRDWAVYRLPR